ncbi:hypothetical protein OROMI_006088 [Orobanche minor]
MAMKNPGCIGSSPPREEDEPNSCATTPTDPRDEAYPREPAVNQLEQREEGQLIPRKRRKEEVPVRPLLLARRSQHSTTDLRTPASD